MMSRTTIAIAALLVGAGVALSAPSASALPQGCWGKLTAPLLKGGFADGAIEGLDCSDYYSLDIQYVGRTNGLRKYRVYSALRALKSPAGGPGHGNQQVLIFDDHMNYVGVYRVIPAGAERSGPNIDKLWIAGTVIHFHLPHRGGNVIRLGGAAPPEVVLVNGEEIHLWASAR
jgi:hypothetical protein